MRWICQLDHQIIIKRSSYCSSFTLVFAVETATPVRRINVFAIANKPVILTEQYFRRPLRRSKLRDFVIIYNEEEEKNPVIISVKKQQQQKM